MAVQEDHDRFLSRGKPRACCQKTHNFEGAVIETLLGAVPDPHTQKRYVDLDLAKFHIDTLKVLSSHISSYVRGKTIISAVNAILLVYLFANYLDMYRMTKSSFTLGLVFLSAALLSYSLFTNPVLLSFTSAAGDIQIVRYFNFVPDLLTTMASTILIYLSRQ